MNELDALVARLRSVMFGYTHDPDAAPVDMVLASCTLGIELARMYPDVAEEIMQYVYSGRDGGDEALQDVKAFATGIAWGTVV